VYSLRYTLLITQRLPCSSVVCMTTYATTKMLASNLDIHTLSKQIGNSAAMIESHYSELTATMVAQKMAKLLRAMENKFEDLHTELVKHLCEVFIDYQHPLRDKKSFINDPQLDILIFEILVHQLWGKPTYENSISDFLKTDKAEQYAFDDRLRDHVYDILCKARGASGSCAKSECIDCS